MECDYIVDDIKTASALVGPVHWRDISITKIADGWYVSMCEKIGMDSPSLPSNEDVEWIQDYMRKQARTR